MMKPEKIPRNLRGISFCAMSFQYRYLLLVLLAFLTAAPSVDAQIFQRRRATEYERPPNALLVMLPTATRKLEVLHRMGDEVRAQSLRQDVAEIQRKMVADFRENFSFCPVYFFYDTASSAIRNGDFAAYLQDTALQPVPSSAYEALADGEHLIAFFGYRSRDVASRSRRGDMEYFEMYDGDTEAMIQQLVLLDSKMEQLVRPLPRTVANRFPGIKTRNKRPSYHYRHYAKYFDMQYKPSASRADAVLSNFYSRQRTVPAATAAAQGAMSDASPK